MRCDIIDQEKCHTGLIKITKKLEDVTTMKQSYEQVSFKSWIKVGIVLHRFVMICHAVRVQVKYDIYHPYDQVTNYLENMIFFWKNYCGALEIWNSATFGSDGLDPMY